MSSAEAGPLLGYAEVAELTGLSAATLRGYAAAGRMPAPEPLPAGWPSDRPRWRQAVIDEWLAARPGRGAPGRPRARRGQRVQPG